MNGFPLVLVDFNGLGWIFLIKFNMISIPLMSIGCDEIHWSSRLVNTTKSGAKALLRDFHCLVVELNRF